MKEEGLKMKLVLIHGIGQEKKTGKRCRLDGSGRCARRWVVLMTGLSARFRPSRRHTASCSTI
jgi:hypothetical protein